jgi:hypothetical protein
MATQAEIIRANIRDNATRDAARQMGSYGESEVQELANGIPSVSNDAALAKHIEEWKLQDVSYQRARTEEDRQQIEAAYTATQQRLNAAKQAIKDRAAIEAEQQNQADISAGDRLALQIQALTDTFPPNWTAETLPIDKLRQLSDLRQQVQNLAALTGAPGLADGVLESGGPLAPANVLQNLPQPQPQAKPETFPDGSLYQLQNLPDGNMEVRLITGEVFKGDPLTVTQRMAEAQVNTKRWAQRARQSQPTAEPPQLNQQPQQQIIPPEPTQQSTIADYWAEQQAQALAKQFGFSGADELRQWGETVNQKVAAISQYEDDRLAMDFCARCPDFPATPEASDAIANIVESQGWQWNADSLQAAHLLAVQNHMYQPISPEEPQVTRPAPPPMLRTNNPEISFAQQSPYEMNLADLRKAAIKQELERNTPGYR